MLAPLMPVTVDEHAPWNLMQRALGFDATRSLPGWWSTVLPVLTAVTAMDAAGRRPRRAARNGWVLMALLLAWLSLDHLVTIHEAMSRLTVAPLGPLAQHPVETILLVVGVVTGLLLVATERLVITAALASAAGAYAVSAAVDAFGIPGSLSPHHTVMVEAGTSWAALLIVLWAARADLAMMPQARSSFDASVALESH